jgi:hypothetical protein
MPIFRNGSVELTSRLAEENKAYDGKPDPFSEQLEAASENPKAAEAREELKRWHRFPRQPWAPPDALTEAAIAELEDQQNIDLEAAINLMAFGSINPNPPENLESGARRQQALNAICNSKKFSFVRDGALVNVPEDTPPSLWPETKIREAADFIAWLRQCCDPSKPESLEPIGTRGKIPLVVLLLKQIFPIEKYPDGVPPPALAPRQTLIQHLLDSAPALGKKLDEATLKKAIGIYNSRLAALGQ